MLFLLSVKVMAGRPEIKYGDIKPKDFEKKVYSIDSNANAIIIADFGSRIYEGDKYGGFSIMYKRHLRIHLLNRNGFEAANISIPLYKGSTMEEKVDKIEATTFNLVDGKVVETKLDKASIFKDKLNKYYVVQKFTMPDLKEGCIIDIQYKIISPFEQFFQPWYFQGSYPVLWSELKATIPTIFDFVFIKQGYHPYIINESKISSENYNIWNPGTGLNKGEIISLKSTTVNAIWAMENVPALKRENFTTTVDNHISKLEFQLSKLRYPNAPEKNIMNNWSSFANDLMKDPDFGEELTKSLGWLADDNKKITAGTTNPLDAAKKIFEFVRDNYTCTSHNARYKSAALRKIVQSKSGNVADLNILLTAMMLVQGYNSSPVLLSTRDHGKAFESYPILDKFNYVVCRVIIDEQPLMLDASQKKLGFAMLNSECYNGFGRIISERPLLVNLEADSLMEYSITSFFLFQNEKGGLDVGYQSTLGNEASFDLRETIAKQGKAEYLKNIKKGYSGDIGISNMEIDSLNIYEEPIKISYNFHLDIEEDIVYIDPMMSAATKTNPFTSANRLYPVEMSSRINESIIFRMDIPQGYMVDEIPKSTRVKLNEDEGMFEYLVSASGGIVQVRSKIQLHKATFQPEDYESLRDFFAYIVKKHSEQIVLKKIKK